jgi:hypothetical protein
LWTGCLRILSIFFANVNHPPIQQELAIATTFDDKVWDRFPRYEIHVPFPFITTCLVLGASLDIKEGYNATVSLEPFDMCFDDWHYDDGITVIDITDLGHVRYCFVLWNGCDHFRDGEDEDSQSVNVPHMKPLSGPLYLEAYHRGSNREKPVPDFEGWDLIPTNALRSAWAKGHRQDSLSHEGHLFGECKNHRVPASTTWQTAPYLHLS